jgi:hypothetical protein
MKLRKAGTEPEEARRGEDANVRAKIPVVRIQQARYIAGMNISDTVLVPTVINEAGAQVTPWTVTDITNEMVTLSLHAGPGKKDYTLKVHLIEIGKNGENPPLYMYTNKVTLTR